MEQFGAKAETFFPSITITVRQKSLPVQAIESLRFGWKIGFKVKGGYFLFNPERRLRRCPGCNTQRYDIGVIQCQRRETFEAGNALA